MPLTVTMPQLGESVTEGTIARWLKQPGEKVERYEAIAEVVTDKVNAEIPSPAEGVMGELIAAEGAVVPVGAPICSIETGDGAAAAPPAGVAAVPAAAQPASAAGNGAPAAAAPATAAPAAAAPPLAAAAVPTPPALPAAAGPVAGVAVQPPAAAPTDGGGPATQHVTPAVRMLAREHGVDLATVPGSGLGGRVTKKDVLGYVQRRGAPAAPLPAAGVQPAAAPAPAQLEGDTLVPLTPARRAIAEHMVRSRQTSPHAWAMVEVDMTRVVRLRARNRDAVRQATGVDLTFLPFVARATITALRQHPTLNATFTTDGVLVRRDIHLGIAVALEENLIVPVVRDADRLSLVGLAEAMRDLGERARSGKLRLDEIQGGTFTLNNTGALGTVLTAAIINQPQAAILCMDTIVKRPVVVQDDAIAVRSMMNVSISFDHRINDGLQAARFLQAVKHGLEGIDEDAPLY